MSYLEPRLKKSREPVPSGGEYPTTVVSFGDQELTTNQKLVGSVGEDEFTCVLDSLLGLFIRLLL